MAVKPIKPEEILERKAETIPDEMFQAINELIALKWNGSSATFRQDDLIEKYFEITGQSNLESNRQVLFNKHLLDFEDIYRKEGWHVYYNKPAYNESYHATFEFKIGKK
jgi:hypothetical protein